MCNNFKIRPTNFSCGGEHFSKGGFASSGCGPADFYTSQKINIFLRTLYVLEKFDLANQGVRQPVQLHTFNAQLPVFDETLAQPDFVVVNCSDVVMSLFHSPVLTGSRYLCSCSYELLCRSVEYIFRRYLNLER